MRHKNNTSSKERRQETRHIFPLSVFTEEGYGINEYLINISHNGCCMASPATFNRGEHVLLHFEVPEKYCEGKRSFCLDGRVVWIKTERLNQFRYGLHFHNTTGDFLSKENKTFHNIYSSFISSPYVQEYSD